MGSPVTAVPPIQWTPQGPIAPSDADILAGRQIDINNAFGGGVNPQLTTPQGQIATTDAAIIADKNDQILYVANQVDPQYSTGRFQDGIGRIYFLTRLPARATAVNCVLGGLPSTSIPAGTLARDTSGNTYTLLGTVVIGSGSTANSEWQNITVGPIPCPANTLTKVYQSVPGWDTINNPADGVLGQDVETPQDFELRRQNSVAINALGSVPSIYAAVAVVDNVLMLYVIDNPRGAVVNTGSTNYPMAPNSLYVGVVGGANQDIANAIWIKKDTGCNYNGNTTATVQDTNPVYAPTYPSYPVTFNRPTSTNVLFAVTISNSPSLPSNIVAMVQAAIIAQFTGQGSQVQAQMGTQIIGSSYYASVIAVYPAMELISILVGISTPTNASITMGIDQAPVIDAGNITVSLI